VRPMIHVQPTPELRRAFAVWATEQRPKVRTVSTVAFAVPPNLFVTAPEEILIGALVDGHRYVSPYDHASAELLGVATPADLTPAPGSPEADAAAMVAATSAALVERAMGAALVAADLAASNKTRDEPADDEHDQDDDDQGDETDDGHAGDVEPYACDLCPRTFGTERGRDAHRRQVHRKD
jgi:hypothetical protein